MSAIITMALSDDVAGAASMLRRYELGPRALRDECDAIWSLLDTDEYRGRAVELATTAIPHEPLFIVGRSYASDAYSTRYVALGAHRKAAVRIDGKMKSVRRIIQQGSWPVAMVMRWGDPARAPQPASYYDVRLSNNAAHYALSRGEPIGIDAAPGPVFSMGGTIVRDGTDTRPVYPSDIGIVASEAHIDEYIDALVAARSTTHELNAAIERSRMTEKAETSDREIAREARRAARRKIEATQTETTSVASHDKETETLPAVAPKTDDCKRVRRPTPKRPTRGDQRRRA